jgi:hypothetical protein
VPPAKRSGAVGGRRNVPDLVSRGYVPPPLHSVVRELLESDWSCDLCGDELTVAFSVGNVGYRGCRNDPRMKAFLPESSPGESDS